MNSRREVVLSVAETVLLDGAPVEAGTWASLLESFSELIETGGAHLVVTSNVDQVVEMTLNDRFRRVVATASIRILDGMPLVFLARILGARGAERRTGADLVWQVAHAAPDRNWTVVFAGGADGVATRAAETLRSGPRPVDARAVDIPLLDTPEDPSAQPAVNELSRIRPHIVFLGLGSPKQELWWAHWRSQLPPGVYVGSGAAADFVVGSVSRAPQMFQRMGFEWIWRLRQEPRRLWHRYLVRGPRFIRIAAISLIKAAFARRRSGKGHRHDNMSL